MLHFKPHTCTDPLQSLWWFGSDQCSQLLCQVAHNTSSLTGTLPPCGVYMCSKQPKDQSWQVALKALDCNSGYGCWFDLSLLHLKTGILCLGDHWEYCFLSPIICIPWMKPKAALQDHHSPIPMCCLANTETYCQQSKGRAQGGHNAWHTISQSLDGNAEVQQRDLGAYIMTKTSS